jgi:7,8-dihydropterin-6-yl-methyl-4-(beta-D-ribofuranosyl)aminobenzene 5'-phosphate synthase
MDLKEVDRVEITTVVDNGSDLLVMDSNQVVQRVQLVKDGKMAREQVVAEHGFSALVEAWTGDRSITVLFDAGLSTVAVPFNLRSLGVDLGRIEAVALSHGHLDHFGALLPVLEMLPRRPVDLVVHPGAFAAPRYLKFTEDFKVHFPELTRKELEDAGAELVETVEPYPLGGGSIIFLGEIARTNDFEKGMPIAFLEQDGEERWDPIADDTALVVNVRGKGLVVLSGCAHSGIINTVEYARKVTGVDQVHAVIGGFHLQGPSFEPIIERTVEEMRRFAPSYVVPAHCTGVRAARAFEEAMPEAYVRNLSGTKYTFTA